MFMNGIRKNKFLFPSKLFANNHNMSFSLREWSRQFKIRRVATVKSNINSYIAFSIIMHILILLCGDVHMNPGPDFMRRLISVCHANVRSIKGLNRFDNLKCELAHNFDVITLSETWLSKYDKSCDYDIDGYQQFRRDRADGETGYGGIMAYVMNNIPCKRRVDLESPYIEGMWLEISLPSFKLFTFVVYRAGNSTNSDYWKIFQENIDNVRSLLNPKILITGDLNADPGTRQGKNLENFTDVNSLTQHVLEPTRITLNSSSLLDVFLTNFPSLVKEVKVYAPIGSSDHCMISLKIDMKRKKKKAYIRRMWEFKKANFELYRDKIRDTDWEECFNKYDIDEICKSVNENILSAANEAIPNRMVTVRPNDKPWFTGNLRRLLRKKHRLFKRFKSKRDTISWESFSNIRNEYKDEIELAKKVYNDTRYSQLADEGIRNGKKWWTLLKQVYNGNDKSESIPPLQTDNNIITDDEEKAEIFNQFFKKASEIDESNATIPDTILINTNPTLSSINVTYNDVKDQIETLKTNKAYGHDLLSPLFYKEAGDTLISVLQRLFNMSLSTGVFPATWKKANIIPLHKKGCSSDVKNYRPVSLLCVGAKIFERIVFKYMYNFMKENFVINDFQSGFQSGRSTVTQLVELYHQFCNAIDQKKEVRVVFLDIKKAFDKVWHRGLIHKLRLCGINGNLLKWLESYLRDREQRVVINGQHSEWDKTGAGVPQGSVLGPLLFLIYINDITSVINFSNIRLFADDTCLFIEVDNREDALEKIESDLSCIETWAKNWLIHFAPDKTKTMTISFKKDANKNSAIHFMGHEIEEVIAHKYLGLWFTKNLSWNPHISNVEVQARKKLNMILPLKFKLDRKTLELLFNVFVSSSMYYGVEVWGGSYDSHLLKLEQIVVDGMRLVTGATQRSNISKLYDDTGWQSVQDHRDYAMLLLMFKMKNGLVPNYLINLMPKENRDVVKRNLRSNTNLRLPLAKSELVRRSFIPFTVKLWNKLTSDQRSCKSIKLFKSEIKTEKITNILYYYGQRWPSIHHSRIRLGCSSLNFDLYYNLHIPDVSPQCICGNGTEDARHYFMSCDQYNDIRKPLKDLLVNKCSFRLNYILNGCENLGVEDNMLIFDAVHNYILESKRFA